MTDVSARPAPLANSLDQLRVGHADLGGIARYVEPLAVGTLGQDAVAAFERDATIAAIPVFEDGRPIGILNRNKVFLSFASQFGFAVFAKRTVAKLMTPDPFVVEASTPLDDFRRRLIEEAPQPPRSRSRTGASASRPTSSKPWCSPSCRSRTR